MKAVGIDGGGTGTRGLLVVDGEEVARARGGPSAIDPAAPARAAEVVSEVVRQLIGHLERDEEEPDNRGPEPLDLLAVGIAGGERRSGREEFVEALAAEGFARRISVCSDGEATFHAAFGAEGPGLLLIAGTGSILWARGADGRPSRVGGWGPLLGDEGSGYGMGLAALRTVARASDGRCPPTALVDGILAVLRLQSTDELIPWAARAARYEIAALAPVVRALAAEGDPMANAIVEEALDDLEELVDIALECLGPWAEPPELALAGGLVTKGGALRDLLLPRLEVLVRVRPDRLDAPAGAIGVALSREGQAT